MSQIFKPGADWVLRLTVSGVLFVFVAGFIAWQASLTSEPPRGQPQAQPILFSHKHHVAEDGLDCRYCHTSVESSSFAGYPATSTCMTCHSQLYRTTPMLAPLRQSLARNQPLHWRRVHELPDFVYFNHSIHVHAGVGCASCHGPVETMQLTYRAKPLTMGWCLSCHRDPAPNLRPREAVFDMRWKPPANRRALGQELIARYRIDTKRLTDCSVCHR